MRLLFHSTILFAICWQAFGFKSFAPLSHTTQNNLFGKVLKSDNSCSYRVKSRASVSNILCQERDNMKVSKGLNILELTGSLVPQGYLVKIVKTGKKKIVQCECRILNDIFGLGWSTFWKIFMQELAPQDRLSKIIRIQLSLVHSCMMSAFST